MKHSFLDDDEDMDASASGSLMNGQLSSTDQQSSSGMTFCGFLSVQYYQPYFDMDTEDITNRITASTLYCGRQEQFFSAIEDKPDLYGPFWVSMKLKTSFFFMKHLSHPLQLYFAADF